MPMRPHHTAPTDSAPGLDEPPTTTLPAADPNGVPAGDDRHDHAGDAGRGPTRGWRHTLNRVVLAVLALFVGLVVLGIVLQATGAVPAAGSPAATQTTVLQTPQSAPFEAPPTTVAAAPPVAAVPPAEIMPTEILPAAVTPIRTDPTAVSKAPAVAPRPRTATTASPPPAAVAPARPEPALTYYANCTAARSAGVAPLHLGDPGYRSGLDRNNNGIACE